MFIGLIQNWKRLLGETHIYIRSYIPPQKMPGRRDTLFPFCRASKKICDILNAVDDELGNMAADYIYEAFIESGLVTEHFDTTHTDVTDNPHLFPLVHAILKWMNPTMQMFYDTRLEWWGSRRGQVQYHAAFAWDSRLPWYIPQELFGAGIAHEHRNIEEEEGDKRPHASESPTRILKEEECVDVWEMKEYLHPRR